MAMRFMERRHPESVFIDHGNQIAERNAPIEITGPAACEPNGPLNMGARSKLQG